jgi:hypothetical protein
MILRASLLVLPLLATLALAGIALGDSQSQLAPLRDATDQYHDLQTAIDEGYTVELPDVFGETCIADLATPSEGAMGVHMVSLDRVGNPALDATNPEALVYERRNNGTLKLVAVEYVVFDTGQPRPKLFGVPFDRNDGSRFGLPPFYALHAWVWKPNPFETSAPDDTQGIFNAWNPRVTCD